MTTEQPPRPPRPGYYWEETPAGWREVRPMNWFWLAQYSAKKQKGQDNAKD